MMQGFHLSVVYGHAQICISDYIDGVAYDHSVCDCSHTHPHHSNDELVAALTTNVTETDCGNRLNRPVQRYSVQFCRQKVQKAISEDPCVSTVIIKL